MSIDHDKLLALVDRMERHAERLPAEAAKMLRHYIAALRALAQPAEAVEGDPMRATHFCISGEEVGGDSVDDVAEQWIETASLEPGERFDIQAWAHTQTYSVLVTDDWFSVDGIEAGDAYQELIDAIKGDAAQGAVDLIVRDCCEADCADPDDGETICIRRATLEGIIERHMPTHPQAAPAPESPSLKQIVPDRERGPEPDPYTGADRGSCCEHAYADGWNDCVGEVEKRVAVAAQAAPAHAKPWGFHFVDVVSKGYEGSINLFWGDHCLALARPPLAAHVRKSLLAAAPAQGDWKIPISWADFWIDKGNWQRANDYEAFDAANQWLNANLAAAPSQGGES